MATVTIGKIGNIEGSVEVVHADGSKGSLEQGALVFADDAITTSEDSNARIEFLDGSAMNIGPEFTAILGKDVFDPALIQEEVSTPPVVLESSDREIVPESGFDTQTDPGTIGYVEKAQGVVEAVGEDGVVRLLKTDDTLYANDVIRIGSDGSVTIRMVDGSDLSFGPGTLARMGDSGVSTLASSEPAAITEPAQIAAIIQEGRDPTEEAAAPTAGETTGNEGVEFTIIEPSHRAVTPTSGHDTHGFELPFSIPEPELLIPDEEEPGNTTVVTASATGPDNTVYEAGLPGGSTAGDGRDSDTGTFTIKATDGILELIIDSEGLGAGGAPVTFTLAEVQAFATTNGVVDMGEGILTLTGYTGDDFAGTVDYSYTLKDNIDNDSLVPVGTDDVTPLHFDDTALITVNGIGGSTGSDELLVRAIDDVPTAVDDTNSIVEDTVAPISGSVLPNDTTGADVPASFVSWASTTASYGTFTDTGGGTYEYLLDNTDPLVQGLDTGDSLTETFNYTMEDEDGDTSTATLTITINGLDDITTVRTAAVTGPDNTVYEAGLVPDGSSMGDGSDTDTGTFTINATDGILELIIDSEGLGAGGAPVTFTLAEVQAFATTNGVVDMGEGILTLTGYTGDPALGGADFAGEVAYSYTLKDNIDNDSLVPVGTDDVTPLHFDDTALITVNGIGGSTGSDELLVRAIDDVPTAVDDTNSIVEDTVAPISGSVLPNDTTGADVPASFVSWASTTASYGTFTDTGGGTYEYLLDNTDPLVQGLDTGDSLTETFNYTMEDEDGDTSTATLTITINGLDDITTVRTAAVTGPDNTVYEAGLVPDGSSMGDGSDTDTGTFTINATDGILELIIDSEGLGAGGAPVTFTLAEVQAFATTNGVVDMGEGILTLTGYTGDPALGGADFAGEVAYSYTLKDNIDNDSLVPVGTDDVTPLHFDDTALITVNGIGGSTGSDELLVRAIDDVPTAVDDTNSIVEDTVAPISGSVLPNDTTGADVPASFVSWASTTASYGTFTDTGGGTYEYLLDNTDPLVQGLDTGDSLTETFNYTMEDEDGDTSTATLTITINGLDDITTVRTAAVTGPDNTVYEAGLVPDGSSMGDGSDTDTGTFTINATDGILELIIDSEGLGAGGAPVTFTLAEVQAFATTNGVVDMGEGILTLTGYTGDPALGGADFAGEVAYSYTLKDNIDNDSLVPVGTDDVTPLHFDDTALITVNGIGGSTGSDELLVRAIDDVPTAVDDTNSIVEDTVAPISGSVLPNDTTGADVPASFVSWASTTASYGTFTDTGGGTYEYLLDNTDPLVQGLDTGDSLTETFNYTMEDEDGDTSTATLTITINGLDDITTVRTAAVTGPDNTVYEAGLVPDGSSMGDGSDTDTGTFTINATDGILELIIDSEGLGAGGAPVTFTLAEVQAFATTNGVVDMGEGILTLTGYTGDPALGGADFAGEVAYSYTLKDNIDNDSLVPVGTDDVTPLHFDDTALITVNGIGGSTGSDELLVRAIDDVPTAHADTDRVLVSLTTNGNVITGADANDPDGNPDLSEADISGADTPIVVTGVVAGDTGGTPAVGNIGGAGIVGTLGGTLTLQSSGAYEYEAAPNVLGTDVFTYTITDGDDDTSTTTLSIDVGGLIVGSNADDIPGATDPHTVPNQAGPLSGVIQGGGGDDVLIGDVGGATIDRGTYNLVLTLDVSGSINDTELQLMLDAVDNLLGFFVDADAVYIEIIKFAGTGSGGSLSDAQLVGTYTNVADAQTAVGVAPATFRAGVGTLTNYQAALTLTDTRVDLLPAADFTTVYFLSDGNPTTGSVDNPAQITALEASLGFPPADVVVNGVGIGDSLDIANLAAIDNTADGPLEVTNFTDLEAALETTIVLSDVGADEINGGAGDDVIYGDVLNSDNLASSAFGAAGDHDGEGYAALIAHLEDDGAGGGLGVGNVENINVIDFITANLDALSADGRGQADTLDGGDGNDIIFGQGGNDEITGGTGSDTLSGGDGADYFIFAAGDGGSSLSLADVITDFTDGTDQIDLDGLAFGTGAGQATFVAADTLGLGGSASDSALIVSNGAGGFTEVMATIEGVLITQLDSSDIV